MAMTLDEPKEKLDVYTLLAAHTFAVPYEKVTRKQRSIIKNRAFIKLYSLGWGRIGRNIDANLLCTSLQYD